MRGADIFTESLVAMRHLDDFVSQIRPLRPLRKMVNETSKITESLLSGTYAADIKVGRPTVMV